MSAEKRRTSSVAPGMMEKIDAQLLRALNNFADQGGIAELMLGLVRCLRWLVLVNAAAVFVVLLMAFGVVGLWLKPIPKPDPVAVNSKNQVFPVQTIGKMGAVGAAEFATRVASEAFTLPFFQPEKIQEHVRGKFTERGFISYKEAMKVRIEEMQRLRLNFETQVIGAGRIEGEPQKTASGVTYYTISVPVAVSLHDGTATRGAGARHDLILKVAAVRRSIAEEGYQIMSFTYKKL